MLIPSIRRQVPATILSVLLFALSTLLSGTAIAGPHRDGALIITTNPDVEYTATMGYCGAFDLESCDDAITNLPASSEPFVWWVAATFPSGMTPRLRGVAFGIDYDESVLTLIIASQCGDFEISSEGWPGPGEGSSVTWNSDQVDNSVPIYWFAGYEYYGVDTAFSIIPPPYADEVQFADYSIPPIIDEIFLLGSLGFNGNPGSLPCPEDIVLGACCIGHCDCSILGEEACEEVGGDWFEAEPCSPVTCECSSRACCLPDGACVILLPVDCEAEGGDPSFANDCDPDPCEGFEEGACCLNGTCWVYTEEECESRDGEYQGDGVSCSTAPCIEPCDPVVPEEPNRAGGEGPNVGGVLVIHANPELEYSTGGDFCAQSGLEVCEDGVVRSDSGETTVLHLLAVFPDGTSPSVKSVTFGISYPECVAIEEYEFCSDWHNVDFKWPLPGSGAGVAWFEVQTVQVLELGWLAASVDPGFFGNLVLQGHPTQGANFYDDGVPGHSDPVADFGRFGFLMDGYLPCPASIVPAACCFDEGICRLLTEEACESEGGLYQGSDVTCDPNPCDTVPTIDTSWGKLKKSFQPTGTRR